MSAASLQIYIHPKLGVVIFDPVAQMGLTREQMRLFKLGSKNSSTFLREIVSKDLVTCTEEAVKQEPVVEIYRAARANRRKPYCEQCRRHYGSVDFSLCKDCNAISCSCGKCACVSTSRRRKAA